MVTHCGFDLHLKIKWLVTVRTFSYSCWPFVRLWRNTWILCASYNHLIFFLSVCLLLLNSRSSLCISDINTLPDIFFANIFSHSISCLLALLIVSVAVQSFFLVWCRPVYLLLAFVMCAFGLISKKPLQKPVSRSFFPIFYSRSFVVSGFAFKSLIHLELMFVYRIR